MLYIFYMPYKESMGVSFSMEVVNSGTLQDAIFHYMNLPGVKQVLLELHISGFPSPTIEIRKQKTELAQLSDMPEGIIQWEEEVYFYQVKTEHHFVLEALQERPQPFRMVPVDGIDFNPKTNSASFEWTEEAKRKFMEKS